MTTSPVCIIEPARAKINLTLRVFGRCPDGYHALSSLVAFAGAGDLVTLMPGSPEPAKVTGPFADALHGENLIDRALVNLHAAYPALKLGRVVLEKNLPVAAGIGGGSADAAAVLRAIGRLNPTLSDTVDSHSFARRLGADVPVCLSSRTVWMSGSGEHLTELTSPPPVLNAVLVNPMAAVPADKTAQVFRRLGAATLAEGHVTPAPPAITDRTSLLDLMAATGNDLEQPAMAVVPDIAAVLETLRSCPGLEVAQLSGAGPTCFGIFPDAAAAQSAASRIAREQPGWWISATTLG